MLDVLDFGSSNNNGKDVAMFICRLIPTVSNVTGLHNGGGAYLYSYRPDTSNGDKIGGTIRIDCSENIKPHSQEITADDQFGSSACLSRQMVVTGVVPLAVLIGLALGIAVRTTVEPTPTGNWLVTLWAQTRRCYTCHDDLPNRLSTARAIASSAGPLHAPIIALQSHKHNTITCKALAKGMCYEQ